jgi:hypothetical protein
MRKRSVSVERGGPKYVARAEAPTKIQMPVDPAAGLTKVLIRNARVFLAEGGTIEDALDCVMEAARREFACRVLVEQPMRLRIDGHTHIWPASDGNDR